ncbi:MAG: LamG domain-containing protein [Candidatus Poribacteria bacterium]|nr:LamG domain-containing protein [Candidatus Poribacteria bacterium]
MKSRRYIIISTILSLIFCQFVFAAGGKGNVKQLGEKLYVWHLDEGTGKETKDATAGLVGKFNGDVEWTTGILGKAVQMAGTAAAPVYIEVPHSNEVDMDEAITMMAWVYIDELPVGPQENKNTIFYKNTYYLQIEPGAGNLAYYFYDTDNPGYHISFGKITPKEWTHIAVVWDGSDVRFYINGEHDGTAISQKGVGRSSPNKVLRFGGENNACCPRFFVGIMDEVMLANYPLTEAEIQRIVNDTLDVSAHGKLTTTWGNLKM